MQLKLHEGQRFFFKTSKKIDSKSTLRMAEFKSLNRIFSTLLASRETSYKRYSSDRF